MNSENSWKAKDAAIFLVTSLACKKQTAKVFLTFICTRGEKGKWNVKCCIRAYLQIIVLQGGEQFQKQILSKAIIMVFPYLLNNSRMHSVVWLRVLNKILFFFVFFVELKHELFKSLLLSMEQHKPVNLLIYTAFSLRIFCQNCR